ncbi:glycosyltransferase [Fusobacterium ulcerans]|uniref:glycosyltransferase n=1 Tax=Fusobacterium ulcerans TaxID=861 RepID=UPI002E79E078|nr:glycosyltransferase [Fusobacterium ulcerans]MEE0138391.1 glycosyltransferase [Fusobacterium ulcerans]
MKLIFFGDHVSEILNLQKAKNPAGNKWQKNLINSLKKYSNILVVSYFRPKLFFKSHQLFVPNSLQKEQNKQESILLKFFNFPVLREICLFFSTINILIKINSNNKQESLKILQYNLYFPVSWAIFLLSFIYKYEFIPIILDIVLEKSYQVSFIKRKYLKFELIMQKIIFKKLRKVIVINEMIIEDFFDNVKYLVIEGGVSQEDISKTENLIKTKRNMKNKIVFTGTLDKVNGVDFLINSIKNIENQCMELDIYGIGELEEFVRKSSIRDKRIKYKGFKKNDEILERQKNASFLIIPRKRSNKILRYTFPSKLFEYMLSETPVICTNIPGLKQEYQECLYVIDTEDEIVFANEISKILKKDFLELEKKAINARKFIIEKKNWDKQGLKILNFCKEE